MPARSASAAAAGAVAAHTVRAAPRRLPDLVAGSEVGVEGLGVEGVAEAAAVEDPVDVARREAGVRERALDGLHGDFPLASSGGLRVVGLADAGDRDGACQLGELAGAAPVRRVRAHGRSRRAVAIQDE